MALERRIERFCVRPKQVILEVRQFHYTPLRFLSIARVCALPWKQPSTRHVYVLRSKIRRRGGKESVSYYFSLITKVYGNAANRRFNFHADC